MVSNSLTETNTCRPIVTLALAVSASYTGLTFVSVTQFVLSDLLIADDASFLAKAAAGLPVQYVRADIALVQLAAKFGSIPAAKALSVLSAAVAAAVIALFLGLVSRRLILSGMAGLTLLIYPISSTPGVFATGAHAYYAAPFAAATVLILWLGWVFNRRHSALAVGMSGTSALMASALSPTAILFPGVPFLLILLWSAVDWPGRKAFYAGLTAALLPTLAAIMLGFTGYHYQELTGWVDVAPSVVLSNLGTALALVAAPIEQAGSAVRMVYGLALISVVGAVGTALISGRRERQAAVVTRPQQEWFAAGLFMIVGSALAFGPGSVVTAYDARYLVLPFLFAGSAGLLAVLWAGASRHLGTQASLAIGLLLFISASSLNADTMRRNLYGPYISTHRQLEELVASESQGWGSRAQVVIMVPESLPSPSSGFNHWSTWYLRNLSGRIDITALIGKVEWLAPDPFVSKYRDHGPEYWRVVSGRSQRVKMKGLLRDRPLYTYTVDRQGANERQVVAFANQRGITVVKHGGIPAEGNGRCLDGAVPFTWPTGSGPVDMRLSDSTHTRTWHLDRQERKEVELVLDEGQSVAARIEVRSEEKALTDVYSHTSPPMPFLSDTLAGYEKREGVLLFDRATNVSWRVPRQADSTTIWIQGREGCSLVIRDNKGKALGTLSEPRLSGEWVLGRGFADRYWQGEITISGIEALGPR